jgi:hypothetical protein
MITPPQIATAPVETVSEKLGREAIFRKVNNREEYFILDLAFSYFQKADRNKRNDYRSGYRSLTLAPKIGTPPPDLKEKIDCLTFGMI